MINDIKNDIYYNNNKILIITVFLHDILLYNNQM